MAKGKYAARAANRLVQTDNELLKEKIAECIQLKSDLKEAQRELEVLQTSLSSEIIRRSDELSYARIREIETACTEKVVAAENKWFANGRQAASRLWDYFVGLDREGTVPRFFVTDIVPMLVPDNELNEFINSRLDDGLPNRKANRYARRHGMENIKRNSNADANNNTQSEALTKALTAAAYGDTESRDKLVQSVQPKALGDE